jgi:glycosyltransferase involved in cell wall biosynthesis
MNGKDQKKIAFFLPNLKTGGTERSMSQLATGFSQRGIPVDFVLAKSEGPFIKSLPPEVRVVDFNLSSIYWSLAPMIRYLHQNRPQVLISALDLANLVAIWSRKLSGIDVKVVVRLVSTISLQQRSSGKKKLEKILLTKFYPQADVIVSVARSVAEDFSIYTGIPVERVHTIYNPVILEGFEQRRQETVHHPWYAPGQPPVVLAVGRLTFAKNFDLLIKAFHEMQKLNPSRLLILGEGEDRPSLEKLVKDLQIEHCVSLPGNIANPFPYMSRSAVFVLSSRYEGSPNALIEAMACGCPVVSLNSPGGMAEILHAGDFGHLVEPGDPHKLAEAILDVLHGNGKKAPADWLQKFELDPVVNQYLSFLDL